MENIENLTSTQLRIAYLNRWRSDEQSSYGTQVYTIINTAGIEDSGMAGFTATLGTANNELLGCMHKLKSSSFTDLIAEADEKRDNAFLGFRYYVEACCYHINPEWVAAARYIETVIRTHGWSLHRKGYDVQSAILGSFNREMDENSEAVNALNTINAMSWYEPLKQFNVEFENLVTQRNEQEAEKSTKPSSEYYKAVQQSLDNLFQYIDIMNKMKPEGPYLELVRKLNEVTENFEIKVQARETRRENAKLENEEK